MLIRRTLHEMSVYTHRVDNMAEGSPGVTWVVCACKLNDLPGGDHTLYTEHVILLQGHLADSTNLGIWWLFETESEADCGIIPWAVTKSRQDDRQQYTFEGRIQWKNIEKTLDKIGDKLTDNDRAFGQWPLLCNDLGVRSRRQKQTFDKMTHNVCHDSSVSVFDTDCNGMRHIFRKQIVCANAGYLWSNPSTGVRRCRLHLQ